MRVLAVLGQSDTEAFGVVQGPSHQRTVLHAGPVVGEDAHPQLGQLAERSQRLPGAPDRDGARYRHFRQRGTPQRQNVARDAGGVDGRFGIRHGQHRGVAAERRGPGAGLDRFSLFATWLTQVRVEVDEAGGDEATSCIEDDGPGRGLDRLVQPDDRAVAERDIEPAHAFGRHDRTAPDDHADFNHRFQPSVSAIGFRHLHAHPLQNLRTIRPPGGGTGWPCVPPPRW